MVTKQVGYYAAAPEEISGQATLAMEIAGNEFACVVASDEAVIAFELFSVEGTWDAIITELREASTILPLQYAEVSCYYHSEEAMVIPVRKFDTVSAADYLSLVFGERYRHDLKHDVLKKKQQVTAYLVEKTLHDAVTKHYPLYQPRHVYTAVLNDLLTRESLTGQQVYLRVYKDQLIIAVLKEGQLQLIRSAYYKTAEDILYYIISVLQQFPSTRANTQLELSGSVAEGFLDGVRLGQLFGEIRYQLPEEGKVAFQSELTAYPAHYFTPFLNLVL